MKTTLFSIGLALALIGPAQSQTMQRYDDLTSFTAVVTTSLLQDFSSYPPGTSVMGAEVLSGVTLATNMSTMEVYALTGFVFAYDSTTRRAGNAFYEVYLTQPYMAFAFDITAFEYSMGPGYVTVFTDDGFSQSFPVYAKSPAGDPVFFGVTSSRPIVRVRWAEALESSSINEETGIDNIRVGLRSGNHRPSVTVYPSSGAEGAPIALIGEASDPDTGDSLSYEWSYAQRIGVDDGAYCTIIDRDTTSPTITCTDDGEYIVSMTANDGQARVTASNTLTVGNVAPTAMFDAPANGALFAANTYVGADVLFQDAGTNDTHFCAVDWGDDTPGYSAACSQDIDLFGQVHPYTEAGVYTIAATVTDDDGGIGEAESWVVVYDPSAGYVSGEGWIVSPVGAYKPVPEMTGRASFGFVSKYRKGAKAPDGNTQFAFQAGDLNFHSSAYDWLVVSGDSGMAQFKGVGTVNGYPNYGFMLSVTDVGNAAGNAANDTFRIKIWDKSNGDAVVYDNGIEQSLGGGNIVISTGSVKK